MDLTYDIGDIGRAWNTMYQCPQLDHLTLYCFHDISTSTGTRVLAQLTYMAVKACEAGLDADDADAGPLAICLHIQTTGEWGPLRDITWYTALLDQSRLWARAHARLFSWSLLFPVSRIVIYAFDTPCAAEAVESYTRPKEFNGWHMMKGWSESTWKNSG